MRKLAAARADVAAKSNGATGETAARLQSVARTLQDAAAPLAGLFDSLQEADFRPTPTVEAAVNEAIKKAESVLAAYKQQ